MSCDNGNGQKLQIRGLTGTVVLTDQQRTFVTEYLKSGNASEAARQAGFNWPGQKGAKLLKTAKIRAAINAELKPTSITQLHVLAELSQLAMGNWGEILDDQGQPDAKKIRANGHMVKKFKATVIRTQSTDQVTVTNVQIELHDRYKALVTLCRMYGMFSETARTRHFMEKFYQVLGEAVVRFVPPENRQAIAAFFRERLDHHVRGS